MVLRLLKLIGKLLREKICIEGLFTTVLKTCVNDGKYYFITQNSGRDNVKSPMGMFDSYAIDNDLAYVDAKIRSYYEVGDNFLSDEEIAEIDEEAKPIFSANNIPRIKDKTGAVLDRLVIVPFNATFSKSDEDYDPYIKYKLRSESAMEYLIQVALDGLNRVLKNNGFTICQAVQNELDEYSEQNNPVIGFLKELEPEIDIYNQPTRDVYLRYKLYCSENGFTSMSAGEFSKILRKEYDLEIKVVKVNGKSVRIFMEV